MNGKRAKQLRKQAFEQPVICRKTRAKLHGDTDYDVHVTRKRHKSPFPEKPFVIVETYVRTLKPCTRRGYKQLKQQYKVRTA